MWSVLRFSCADTVSGRSGDGVWEVDCQIHIKCIWSVFRKLLWRIRKQFFNLWLIVRLISSVFRYMEDQFLGGVWRELCYLKECEENIKLGEPERISTYLELPVDFTGGFVWGRSVLGVEGGYDRALLLVKQSGIRLQGGHSVTQCHWVSLLLVLVFDCL